LREQVGNASVAARDDALWRRAKERLTANPSILIVGDTECARLPIISFSVRPVVAGTKQPLLLHPTFVSLLLNDLFGVQSRPGCVCAGPYGMELLQLDVATQALLAKAMQCQQELLRPGFVRVNLPYFATDGDVDFLLDA
jgi:selenocysteine lyase/cysteine desulfurase